MFRSISTFISRKIRAAQRDAVAHYGANTDAVTVSDSDAVNRNYPNRVRHVETIAYCNRAGARVNMRFITWADMGLSPNSTRVTEGCIVDALERITGEYITDLQLNIR